MNCSADASKTEADKKSCHDNKAHEKDAKCCHKGKTEESKTKSTEADKK